MTSVKLVRVFGVFQPIRICMGLVYMGEAVTRTMEGMNGMGSSE